MKITYYETDRDNVPKFQSLEKAKRWIMENYEPSFSYYGVDPVIPLSQNKKVAFLPVKEKFDELGVYYPFSYQYYEQRFNRWNNIQLGWETYLTGEIEVTEYDDRIVFSQPLNIRFRLVYDVIIQEKVQIAGEPYRPEIKERREIVLYDFPLYLSKSWHGFEIVAYETNTRCMGNDTVYIYEIGLELE